MLNKNILRAGVVLPLMSIVMTSHPAAAMTVRPNVSYQAESRDLIHVQVSVEGARQQLQAAQQALADAQASGGDTSAAQAAVGAAQAELDAALAAQSAPPPAPEPEPAPAPEPAPPPPAAEAPPPPPAPEPAPPAAEPAPAPEAAPPAAEQPAEPKRRPQRQQAPDAQAPAPEAAPVPQESPAPEKAPVPEQQADPQPGRQPGDDQSKQRPRPNREKPAQRPAAEQPAPAEPAAPVPTPEPAPAPAPDAAAPVPGSAPAPDAPPPPQDGAASGQAPAGEAVPDQVATPQQEAPSMTKEQLDQAKAIAADPSKTDETVILPVDKGAAVLDSDKEAERSGDRKSRDERRREREQAGEFKVPTSDAEAQALRPDGKAPPPIKMEAATAQQGERIAQPPRFERPEGVREWQPRDGGRRNNNDDGTRIILQFGDRIIVRGDDTSRFVREGEEPYYERLPGGRIRETVERNDGTQVVTIRNRYGDIIQRSRIDNRGREYVLFYAPELMERPDREYAYRDPGLDLPPMRLRIPVQDYIIDTTSDPDRDYYAFLEQPPVEPVERVYSLDEVKYSARIRDKVRRIDLDTVTFATGSADIPMNQARTLRKVADAINKTLDQNPAETFLIEGHTDAVGSDESNLILSDRRAESVANILTDVYGIPPENLATQGYGERYLKVRTLSAEQQNRRVTIRRVTPLVRPVAQN